MANKNLFKSVDKASKSKSSRTALTTNNAGGKAYQSSHKHALAQIAVTNTFNGTYYASSSENLELAKKSALKLKDDPEFLAKVAIYSREKGHMKDMPAFLSVILAQSDPKTFRKVFNRVIDNGKMLRNFIQIARSGAIGRTFNMSAGTCRRAIQGWFNEHHPVSLFKASIGNDPSMRDILRMARPRPENKEKAALFAYFLGAEIDMDNMKLILRGKDGSIRITHDMNNLPEQVVHYEKYKRGLVKELPKVDFRFLTSLNISDDDWKVIARNAPWMMTRMNLNTFARHGVFKLDNEMVNLIASRLRDPELIHKSRQFPYQIMSAWMATRNNDDIPFEIQNALQDAMEISIDNVPSFDGNVVVAVDASGSMGTPIIQKRFDYHSIHEVRCVDVAALIASSIVRKNGDSEVYTFSSDAVRVRLNPRDTVLTNMEKLNKAGGGTDISSVLRLLNEKGKSADTVIYVSDYESWLDSSYGSYYGSSTSMQSEWEKYKSKNPNAKLICIDLTPVNTSQVKERSDVLQVGGFSDDVFNVMSNFISHGHSSDHWVSEIESINLD